MALDFTAAFGDDAQLHRSINSGSPFFVTTLGKPYSVPMKGEPNTWVNIGIEGTGGRMAFDSDGNGHMLTGESGGEMGKVVMDPNPPLIQWSYDARSGTYTNPESGKQVTNSQLGLSNLNPVDANYGLASLATAAGQNGDHWSDYALTHNQGDPLQMAIDLKHAFGDITGYEAKKGLGQKLSDAMVDYGPQLVMAAATMGASGFLPGDLSGVVAEQAAAPVADAAVTQVAGATPTASTFSAGDVASAAGKAAAKNAAMQVATTGKVDPGQLAMSAAGGGVGAGYGSVIPGTGSAVADNAIRGAATGGTMAALTGGNPMYGATSGAIGGAVNAVAAPIISNVTNTIKSGVNGMDFFDPSTWWGDTPSTDPVTAVSTGDAGTQTYMSLDPSSNTNFNQSFATPEMSMAGQTAEGNLIGYGDQGQQVISDYSSYGLSPVEQQAVTQAQTQGTSSVAQSLTSALTSGLKKLATAGIDGLTGKVTGATVANAAAVAYAADQAKKAGITQAQGATQAANILSPAAQEAAKLQADAATQSAGTLATGATTAAQQRATGYTQGAGVQSGAALSAGNTLSQQALAGGKALSAADLAAAGQLSLGYQQAAAQKVAGNQAAITQAQQTLSDQQEVQKPFYQAGTQALSQLTEGLKPGGQFNTTFTMDMAQNMPAYQFALEQGRGAIDSSYAAKGGLLSSAALADQIKFAEGTAAQFEQQAFNQWMSQNNLTLAGLQNLVQTGQVSAGQLQSALAQAGLSIETYQQAIGAAQAEGTLGSANAMAQGTLASARDLTTGDKTSAQALADAQKQAAGFTAGGITNAAGATATGTEGASQATAAGQAGSAKYTAGGVTDSAAAQAAGVTGAAKATAAGESQAANIYAKGVSDIGNQMYKTTPDTTPNQTPVTASDVLSQGITSTTPASSTPATTTPLTMDSSSGSAWNTALNGISPANNVLGSGLTGTTTLSPNSNLLSPVYGMSSNLPY